MRSLSRGQLGLLSSEGLPGAETRLPRWPTHKAGWSGLAVGERPWLFCTGCYLMVAGFSWGKWSQRRVEAVIPYDLTSEVTHHHFCNIL